MMSKTLFFKIYPMLHILEKSLLIDLCTRLEYLIIKVTLINTSFISYAGFVQICLFCLYTVSVNHNSITLIWILLAGKGGGGGGNRQQRIKRGYKEGKDL